MANHAMEIGQLSDLVIHEVDPSAGYARRVIKLTNTGAEIKQGAIAYRTVASGLVNQDAAYTLLDGETDSAELADDTNEFAVIFGDEYSAQKVFTSADSDAKAVAFVRGEVQLKDSVVYEASGIDGSEAAVKALLEKQGIILIHNTAVSDD